MPPTPLSPGEPVNPRDDETSWFEPVTAAAYSEDEPTSREDEWPPGSEPFEHARDAVAWRDIRWVEFGDVAQPHPGAVADPVGPMLPAPRSPPNSTAPSVAAAADMPAADDGGQRGSLRSRLTAGAARLLRLGAAVVSLAVLAIFLYHGGELLAGFAGAMTRPAADPGPLPEARPAPQPTHEAAVAPDRLPAPAAAPAGGAIGSRPAAYLVPAQAGEPTAQYNLAVLYALGDGVTQDYPSAASWFAKAAESGNPAAQFNLAVMYERGLGVERDSDAALLWYRRAAEHSYPPAEYNLALAYAEGRGTRPNPTAAARWYHDAAVQGVVPAMVNVAILYETGEGLAASLPDAYAWYRAAARRGDATAEERAQELFRNFTGADKEQAVLMAAAVAEAMREPPPAAASPPPPVVLKPARRSGAGAAHESAPAKRQPRG